MAAVSFDIAAWAFYGATEGKPEVPQVPAMLRRRASHADRMALKTAFDIAPAGICPEAKSVATVFCSRRGEEHRSVELLNLMAAGEGHSPMSFSLSVHNAASGLFGIARNDPGASASLAAGKETLAMGMIEAWSLLARGKDEVLLVNYDDAMPEPLKGFADETDRPYALAMLLKPGAQFSMERAEREGAEAGDPQGLSFAEFLKAEGTELVSHSWRWIRSA